MISRIPAPPKMPAYINPRTLQTQSPMWCTSFRVLQQPLIKKKLLGKKDVGSQFERIESGMEGRQGGWGSKQRVTSTLHSGSRERRMLVFFFIPKPQPMVGVVLPMFKVGISSLVKLLETPSHVHLTMCLLRGSKYS